MEKDKKDKKVLVIALHGKGSNPEKSNTINKIKNYFDDKVKSVVTPAYDSNKTHDEIVKDLDWVLKINFADFDTVAVIGVSLGGYWARYLANRIEGAKYIGLNPSFGFYGEVVDDTKKNLPITLYIAKDDDIVNPDIAIKLYFKRAKINLLDSGGHRLLNVIDDILPSIEKDINIV